MSRGKRHGRLALALMLAMHGHISFAQIDYLQAPSPQEGALLQEDATRMSWPLLPGESVGSLAKLFYPNNPTLQRAFIRRTLQLSRDVQPNLQAKTVSNQAYLIVIPTLKSLARQSGTIRTANQAKSKPAHLQMSYGLKDAAQFVVSPQMQVGYDDLQARNEFLKQQLELLNAKLAALQLQLAALMEEARRYLAQREQSSVAQSPGLPTAAMGKSGATNNAMLVNTPQTDANLTVAANKTYLPQAHQPALASIKDGFSYVLLWPLFALMLAIALFAAWYTRLQAKRLYLASAKSFEPLENKFLLDVENEAYSDQVSHRVVHDVDFSLTQSDLTSQMSVVDLSGVEDADIKEEGELTLEQARIYAHIGRTDEAIALLKAQIESTAKSSPKAALHHWLYLLDIFRDTQQKDEFMKYAAHLHQSFNVMIPLWENEPLPMVIAHTLEEFPHIVQQLSDFWNDPARLIETKAYLEFLMTDNRNSSRTGFSMEVFQEIMLLRDILEVRDKFAVAPQHAVEHDIPTLTLEQT